MYQIDTSYDRYEDITLPLLVMILDEKGGGMMVGLHTVIKSFSNYVTSLDLTVMTIGV